MNSPLLCGSGVSIALLHYPVYDRNRRVVATAVTNLDVHDMARLARTYGLFRFYVVTPVEEQLRLVDRIRVHWSDGWGGSYNPDRRQAMELLRVKPGLEDVLIDLDGNGLTIVSLVATGAKERDGAVSFVDLRSMVLSQEKHLLLLFGTGWGLSDELFDRVDHTLEPVRGAAGYNHLSVRAAAAIILDRILGQ